MSYPKELVETVMQRSQGMQLEGLNSGAGPVNPKLMIVGEAPGKDELVKQVPFCGAAGKELIKSLASIGLTRKDVYITSSVRSRPFAIKKVYSQREEREVIKHPNRKPNKKEIWAHAPFLDYEIKYADPKVIIAVGNTALERLLGPGHLISKEHGQIFKNVSILELDQNLQKWQKSAKKYTVIPQFHPAAVFYNRKLAPLITEDWLKVKPFIKN